MKRWSPLALCASLALAVVAQARAEQPGVRKRRPLPDEFGRVVMSAHAEKARVPPVLFEHWLHRAKFTCRLCHVDIGFAMKAGGTDVRAQDNAKGLYCGACHDGRRVFEGRKAFEACSTTGAPRGGCLRCHSVGSDVRPVRDLASVTRGLPRGRFGNGVDWEKAEEEGLIRPVDYLEDVSIKRQSITAQKDFALSPRLDGMPEIIFSHKKHTVWSGCEGCHPDIFVGVKRGATKYTMTEIFEGRYCGVCHGPVAFPLTDCQRCHAKPVQGAAP